jgi:MinD-like ATPase involved in chromosome partitioning or flagellar assembly
MKKITEKINKIKQFLIAQPSCKDFRISLKLNTDISVSVLVVESGVIDYTQYTSSKIKFTEITENELADNDYYQYIFSNNKEDKIDFSLRRRFNNLINPHSAIETPCPVITFYSYKGGVGRSTTLAAFASHLAMHENKQVIIIDCDFEAPGFTNYFDLEIGKNAESSKEGVVEYLLDKQFLAAIDEKPNLDDYCYDNIKTIFTQKNGEKSGSIRIIPAGNLSQEHRKNYLEALARIDITSTNAIINQFQDLLNDLKEKYSLNWEDSVILIDSRTGFNDTFAVLSAISQIIVGFFGVNIQNKVGIHQFLDNFVLDDTIINKEIVLIQSMSDSASVLKNIVKDYVDKNVAITEHTLGIVDNIFTIPEISIFKRVGTANYNDIEKRDELNESFANQIRRSKANDLEKPFEAITKGIDNIIAKKLPNLPPKLTIPEEIKKKVIEPVINSTTENTNPDIEALSENDFIDWGKSAQEVQIKLRREILENLIVPDLYAETQPANAKDFYFRTKMKEIFQKDSFLIVGGKGTGKTYLYSAFEKSYLTKELCYWANKEPDNYIFVNIISFRNKKDKNLHFDTNNLNYKKDIDRTDFYSRFWFIYICNALFTNQLVKDFLGNKYPYFVSFSFENRQATVLRSIENDATTALWFKTIINNDSLFISEVEDKLKILDKELKKQHKNLFILFDQLDNVVKPTEWKEGITPLIKDWRRNRYENIFAKLFLRSDLYAKLQGINNIKQLDSQAISIEWNKEEIFAYFFKVLLSNKNRKKFYQLFYSYYKFGKDAKRILQTIDKQLLDGETNQIDASLELLEPLVEVFFGKYADYFQKNNTKYGTSYEWFERNFKDALGQVSIRPFWALIKAAQQKAISQRPNIAFPILSAEFYAHSKTREKAPAQYFSDLCADEGNEDLQLFHSYMVDRNDDNIKGKPNKRQYAFRLREFEHLIKDFTEKYPNIDTIKGQTTDKEKFNAICSLLLLNGIVYRTDLRVGEFTEFVFPYLYRGFFQLGQDKEYF